MTATHYESLTESYGRMKAARSNALYRLREAEEHAMALQDEVKRKDAMIEAAKGLIRFRLCGPTSGHAGMGATPDGEWVEYDDLMAALSPKEPA